MFRVIKSWVPHRRSTCGLCGGSGKLSCGKVCHRCYGAGGWG